MSEIASRLAALRSQISMACQDAGRSPDSVKLLAVSKTWSVDAVRAVNTAGQVNFGENYLQEALNKVQSCPDLIWHFIGAVQSNKTRQIASHFSWVHSVPSVRVARRLSDQRDPALPPLNILFQVNTSGEQRKSGLAPEQLPQVVEASRALQGVSLRGLMTIPAADEDPAPSFEVLATLRSDTATKYGLADFTELSMGMSNDFALAIAHGATWIRIGTAIFGPRTKRQEEQS